MRAWDDLQENPDALSNINIDVPTGNHTVSLTVYDDLNRPNEFTELAYLFVTVNVPPVADAGNTQPLTYTDWTGAGSVEVELNPTASRDSDGEIVACEWTNEGGPLADGHEPVSVTLAVGTHDITLMVTDNDGATGQTSQDISVSDVASEITLTAALKGKKTRKGQKIQLQWSGAAGASIEVYRYYDGTEVMIPTANDGAYNDTVSDQGTYTYEVCDVNACSNISDPVTF